MSATNISNITSIRSTRDFFLKTVMACHVYCNLLHAYTHLLAIILGRLKDENLN